MLIRFQCGTCTGKGEAVVFEAELGTTTCPFCGSISITSTIRQNNAPKASPVAPARAGETPGIIKLQVFRSNAAGQFEACGELPHLEDNELGPALLERFRAGTFHVRWWDEIGGSILRVQNIEVPQLPVTLGEAAKLLRTVEEPYALPHLRGLDEGAAFGEAVGLPRDIGGEQNALLSRLVDTTTKILELLVEMREIGREQEHRFDVPVDDPTDPSTLDT